MTERSHCALTSIDTGTYERVLAISSGQAPAISFSDISFSYGKSSFIAGFNLQIPAGRVTGIIGPNGCGKSTLIKLADGLLVPQQGEILIEGEPTLGFKGRERARRLAVLTQAGRTPAMTVENLVACGRYPHQDHRGSLNDAEKVLVAEAMRRCGVEQFRGYDIRFLSGGERQRAFIAMTLVQDTGIIALDEPTTYLDAHACHEIMQLVRELNERDGKTIIMVIHDLDLALRYSDHLAVMGKGRLLSEGTVAEVLTAQAIEQAFQVRVQCNQPSDEGNDASYSLFPR
jgi:iron complex transport system ATP-binding protein